MRESKCTHQSINTHRATITNHQYIEAYTDQNLTGGTVSPALSTDCGSRAAVAAPL